MNFDDGVARPGKCEARFARSHHKTSAKQQFGAKPNRRTSSHFKLKVDGSPKLYAAI
jgi:hypothetical protein